MFLCCTTFVCNNSLLSANAEVIENPNFTNLIVFARFRDEEEFIDDVYRDISVKNLYDNTYSNCEYSVKDYYYFVSNGKLKVQNLFLFDNGKSLQLEHTRGYYAEYDKYNNQDGYTTTKEKNLRNYDLKTDWTTAIANAINNGAVPTSVDGKVKYELSELDKNYDGLFDALTIVYKNTTQNISVGWSDPLWNYQDFYNGVEITANGKKITSGNYLQLTFSSNSDSAVNVDKNGIKYLPQGTIVHETSHILGLKDLYKSSTQNPVGFMSVMGKHTTNVAQYMSIKEREVMGWLDDNQIINITQNGDYTLDVISSKIPTNQILGYKINLTDINKTLYLEYRNFENGQNKFDCKEGQNIKSGLVCYLMDNSVKFPNNLNCSGTNWVYRVVSNGTSSTMNDCAVAQNESLDITSALKVSVKSVTDDKLSFSVSGDALKDNEHTHNLKKIERVEPTCRSDGNIEYYYCSLCGKYFLDKNANNEITIQSTILPKHDHTIVILPYVAPTCTSYGLSEGQKCGECNEIIIPQQQIEKLPHQSSDWIIDIEATTTSQGKAHKECVVCHTILEEKNIDKLTPPAKDDGDKPSTGNDDNNKPNDNNKNNQQNNEDNIFVYIFIAIAVCVVVIPISGLIIAKIKINKRK